VLLDDDEAVTVAISLRTAASGSVTGIEETPLRALTKLEQVCPSRLRYRVHSLQSATIRAGARGPAVSSDTVMAIADACRRHERLRFDYRTHRGGDTVRSVEPHSHVGRHWCGRSLALPTWGDRLHDLVDALTVLFRLHRAIFSTQ
jgi:predicted DNA-binding transcriptional regulator YafY